MSCFCNLMPRGFTIDKHFIALTQYRTVLVFEQSFMGDGFKCHDDRRKHVKKHLVCFMLFDPSCMAKTQQHCFLFIGSLLFYNFVQKLVSFRVEPSPGYAPAAWGRSCWTFKEGEKHMLCNDNILLFESK